MRILQFNGESLL